MSGQAAVGSGRIDVGGAIWFRLRKEMSDLYWLMDEEMERLRPYFPRSDGTPRVDDRRVLSGIVFVNRNGLRWCDAPKNYGPHETLYNR
jgi:transposase